VVVDPAEGKLAKALGPHWMVVGTAPPWSPPRCGWCSAPSTPPVRIADPGEAARRRPRSEPEEIKGRRLQPAPAPMERAWDHGRCGSRGEAAPGAAAARGP
jgi:hypothetical protein